MTRPNDFPLLIVLGFWEVIPTALSLLSHKRKLSSEECKLTFISRFSHLLSPFRTVEHYYKPLTIFVFIVFVPSSNTRQANKINVNAVDWNRVVGITPQSPRTIRSGKSFGRVTQRFTEKRKSWGKIILSWFLQQFISYVIYFYFYFFIFKFICIYFLCYPRLSTLDN